MSRFEPTEVDYEILGAIRFAENSIFSDLVKLANLDPASDIRFSDLDGVDFSGSDLRGFDLTGCSVVGANWKDCIIDETTMLPEMESGAIIALLMGGLNSSYRNIATSVAVVVVDTLAITRFLPAAKSIHPLELTANFEPVALNLLREAASMSPQKVYFLAERMTKSFSSFLNHDPELNASIRSRGLGAQLEILSEVESLTRDVQIVEQKTGPNGAFIDAIEFFVKNLSASHLLLIDPQFIHMPTEYSLHTAFDGWRTDGFNGATLQPNADEEAKVSRFMLGRDTAQRLLDALSESGSDQHTEPFVDLLHRELDPEVVRYLVPQESYSFTKATDTVSLGVGLAMDGAELSTDLTAYLDEMVAVRNTA